MSDLPFLMTDAERLSNEIFHAYAFNKIAEAHSAKRRFVHYTNAETLMRILSTNHVWMRRSACMNDFMEIEHGFECLNAAYKKHRGRLERMLAPIGLDLKTHLEDTFNGWLPHLRDDTYLSCFSEHDDDEDANGRLSMWRAYGGATGVALVINAGPFLRPSAALAAYTSPVAYLDIDQFESEFVALLDRIERNSSVIIAAGLDYCSRALFFAFKNAILCCKHPGFREEREWRVMYTPRFEASKRIKPETVCINGLPQIVQKIPLENVEAENLYGIDAASLIDRVIIGPTNHPEVMKDALVAMMAEANIPNAHQKVFISAIPLRQ